MMRYAFRGRIWWVVALAALAGCSDNSTPIAPTLPTNVVETFTGSILVNGANTYPFSITYPGTVTASLTALSPDTSSYVGLSLGTWNGAYCASVLSKDQAPVNSIVVGRVSGNGALCLRVYDTGAITEQTSYEVQVSHP